MHVMDAATNGGIHALSPVQRMELPAEHVDAQSILREALQRLKDKVRETSATTACSKAFPAASQPNLGYPLHLQFTHRKTNAIAADVQVRNINTPNTRLPEIQLLGNGHYHVMITNSGGGYSRWKNIAVTRWREDATKDDLGIFCYIKDVNSGKFWSNTHQPTLQSAKNYEAIFYKDMLNF